jgi:hypothetical protein
MEVRRWDDDERGEGVADASQFVDDVSGLIAAMRHPTWVAEEPEIHLLPHLLAACEELPFRIVDACTSEDRVYDVRLAWTGGEAGIGAIRASIFKLLGSIAESSSYVKQREPSRRDGPDAVLVFDVVTGMVEEMPFKPHGHTLSLTVVAATPTAR